MHADAQASGLVSAFLQTLAGLPDATGTVMPCPRPAAGLAGGAAGSGPGPVPIAVRLGAAAFTVLAATRTVVFPLDVHQTLGSFAATASPRRGAARPFLLAEAIAPDARRLLQDEQVGYYDRGGSLFLPHPGPGMLPGVLIDRPPPRLAPASPRPDPDMVFSGRTGRVLLTMLDRPDDRFRVNRLARETSVSAGTVCQLFDTLSRQGWLGRAGEERFLLNPGAMLAAWTRQPPPDAPPAPPAPQWIAGLEPLPLLERLAGVLGARGIDHAVEGTLAAQIHAGLPRRAESLQLRWLDTGVADMDALLGELATPGVATGTPLQLTAVTSGRDLGPRRQVGGTWLASPVETYLALARSGRRYARLAERLRDVAIGF